MNYFDNETAGITPTDIRAYWMTYEATHPVRLAMVAYLGPNRMTEPELVAMIAYLRDWISWSGWQGTHIEALRRDVDTLHTERSIRAWLARAALTGIDPT